jgi:hypothetical protein
VIRTSAGLALSLIALGAYPAHGQSYAQTTVNRWIQYGPNNTVLARAIVATTPLQPITATCPPLSVDGMPVAMSVRSTPTTGFPVTECEAQVPPGHVTATIDGVALKLPVANPRRIVVVGDTGCRIKGTSIQACNDPTQFPLAAISNFVASFAPDMIVHVGDFYYREAACPAANAGNGTTTGCGNSPYGDNWASWNADWFTPAQPMMLAAPLALTRGNHESCARGNMGWFTLLDVAIPFTTAAVSCAAGSTYDFTPPYIVKAGQVSLLMFDSSYANDSTVTPTDVSNYQSLLSGILPQATTETIFVTHKPAYGLISATADASGNIDVTGGDVDEQALFANGVPQPIKLLLSGHIHNYQAVQVNNKNYAPQLVIGNSGTLLDPQYVPGNQVGNVYQMPGAATQATVVGTADLSEFGFAVLDIVPGGYTANLYDLSGLPHGRCVVQLTTRTLACSS